MPALFFYEPVSEIIWNVTGREFLLYPYVTFAPLFLIGVWCNLKKKTLVIRNGWILILTIGLVVTLYLQVFRPFSFLLLPGFILYGAARGTRWAGKITPVPDLSYGIYVFAYPIQQLIGNYIRPENSWQMFLISVGSVLPFALFSWYKVEKKALRLKGLVR